MDIKVYRQGMGDPLLLIHGAGGNARTWYYQQKYFEAAMRVEIVELPGHGFAPGDGCDSVDAYADAISEALKEKGGKGYHIVGHSMGGAIAMSLALSSPDLVKSLVLVGTGARLRVFPAILDGLRENKETTVAQIIDLAFSKYAPQEMKENAFRDYMTCRTEVILNDFTACNHFDLMGSIKNIEVPTLILCGTEDSLTPIKYSQYLGDQIKGSFVTLIEKAGHMVMIEKPLELNRAIEKFTTNLS